MFPQKQMSKRPCHPRTKSQLPLKSIWWSLSSCWRQTLHPMLTHNSKVSEGHADLKTCRRGRRIDVVNMILLGCAQPQTSSSPTWKVILLRSTTSQRKKPRKTRWSSSRACLDSSWFVSETRLPCSSEHSASTQGLYDSTCQGQGPNSSRLAYWNRRREGMLSLSSFLLFYLEPGYLGKTFILKNATNIRPRPHQKASTLACKESAKYETWVRPGSGRSLRREGNLLRILTWTYGQRSLYSTMGLQKSQT